MVEGGCVLTAGGQLYYQTWLIAIEVQGVAVGNRVSESTQARGRVGKGGVIALTAHVLAQRSEQRERTLINKLSA